VGVPSPHSPEFEAIARTLRIDHLTAEVVQAFQAAGIRSILLKGPALARWLYDEGAMRPYADCDLLVRTDSFQAAEGILASMGFEREGLDSIVGDWPKHARTWKRPDGTTIDLHVTLVGIAVAPPQAWDILTDGTEHMRVAGIEVEVLSPAARAVLVALNAAKDAARVGKVRHDLGHALDRLPTDLWKEAMAVAARLKSIGAFAAGLRRTPAGERLADELGLPHDTPSVIALRERPPPPLAMGLDWLLATPGWSGKFRVVLRKVAPPPSFLRAWTPIARKGRLGLALAYVWRPVWLAWRVGPALGAWWRVRSKQGKII
jgi:hypothetical protein